MKNARINIIGIVMLNPAAYALSLIISYFLQAQELLIVMTIFVLCDLITGIWKSIKNKGWKSITSLGLRRTIEKLLGYSMFIILGNVLDKSILEMDSFSLIKIFTGLIVLTELKSVAENLTEITENKLYINLFSQAKKLFTKKHPDDESNS